MRGRADHRYNVAEDDEATDPPLAEDTRIGDFRIRGLLGEGAMGQVYLAQDVTLGRRVALKLIKRSVMQGDAVARFLEEARATASFNHPHIVTLHAVGEHDGRPYLALEYVDGESLRARLAAGPLPVREALRHARAIAEAIAEAHRRGIVHADLKPENVVIPRDGRVRVVDFGLAKLAGGSPDASSSSGTPAYMAPERWRGAPPTGAIDVWSLGMMLPELVTGRRPLSDAELMRLPYSKAPIELDGLPAAPWSQLVRECLARDPAERPIADDLVRRLTALLDPRAANAGAEDHCPFPGLAAFSREDAADYFGRRAELDALVEQLRTRALVPIVGPSGIGKSSFVRAALLPRLDEAGRWVALSLRPGASPFDSLAAALALPGRPAAALAESLRRFPDSLSLVLGDVARHHGARVLLFLDQFEETFTLAANQADAVAFCDCLARAAVAAEPWRVVLTVRDDFLGRLAASPAMRPHLGAVLLLPPLSPADLRAAVAGPLANTDYEADSPELIERIVGDVAGQPACLPLLQFTCRSLWERRDPQARRILTAEYAAMGGATGALATHAESFMAGLASDEVLLVRALLLALVHPDGTRQPRRRDELLDGFPAASRETADRLIDRLLDRRLLAATRDAEHDAATIELAHEALATAWPRLARWLDESYEQRVLVADLEQASQLWERRGRREDATWAGVALADAVRKVNDWNISLPSTSRAFLDAGIQRDRRIRRRRRWIASAIVGALTAVAVGAVIAAVAFARKEEEANRQRKELADANEELKKAADDLGTIRLELVPFDWLPALQVQRSPVSRPTLEWTIHEPSPEDAWEVGNEYGLTKLHRNPAWWEGNAFVEHVEIRSGPAFIKIRRGSDCAPSIVYLQRLPGYRDHGKEKPIRISVPTCQASRAGMIQIPAGFFYQSGSRNGQDINAIKDEPAYSIDQTEVTRGAFEIFESMRFVTGLVKPTPFYSDPDPIKNKFLPIMNINRDTARSYCRFLGKDLPTSDQWQKAFRGGLLIDGKPNPLPLRITPWISAKSPRPANIAIDNDGKGQVALIGEYPEDVSPYGVFDLAGNVSEWSRDPSITTPGFYRLHGGNWASPPKDHLEQITQTNTRPEERIDYTMGVRCVSAL
jgi:hypothetical protein